MTTSPSSPFARAPLSPDSAFVAHLAAREEGPPDLVRGRIGHIAFERSIGFASLAEKLGFMRRVVTIIGLLGVLAAVPAVTWSQTDQTCLSGDHPSVVDDASQIAALRSLIDTACPCSSFDGDVGRTRRDYRRCVAPLIKAAAKGSSLRARCKGVVSKVFKLSTCGLAESVDAVPCIEAKPKGKVGCRVLASERCVSDKRATRRACFAHSFCVDAGDDNGDYRVDASDAGECREVAAPSTPTATARATEAPEDTATPTVEPTATATQTPTATATETPTATATEAPTDTPTEAATETPTPTSTLVSTPTAACTPGDSIQVRIDVNKDDDPQVVLLPPAPGSGACAPQTLLGGGCSIAGLDGTIVNFFDASASVDSARCPGDPAPSFHWQLFRPPGLGGTPYSAAGITGYHGAVLTIREHSFPALEDSDASTDPNWRVLLTIQSNVAPYTTVQKWFKFAYTSSALTLQMSTDCQRIGHIQYPECTIEAANGLPATEPT